TRLGDIGTGKRHQQTESEKRTDKARRPRQAAPPKKRTTETTEPAKPEEETETDKDGQSAERNASRKGVANPTGEKQTAA
ncbi:hypothetical protein PSY73_23740, partial [Shigella flexneri]|nr:hypothetical protein [Shigella flexneri]